MFLIQLGHLTQSRILHRILDFVFRDENRVVCETGRLADEALLNVAQRILVYWPETHFPEYNTGSEFTYKPNPRINDIDPRETIVR